MKKIYLLFLILFTIISFTKNSNAITVTVTLPAATTGIPAVDNALTTQAIALSNQLTQDLNNSFGSLNQLSMGMSNANAYSSGSSSLNGYQGYKIWAATIGVLGTTQLNTYNINKINTIFKSFADDGDIYLGIGAGASVNIGIHLGHFIKPLDGLYVNLKIMYLPAIPIPLGNIGKITPSNITAGAGINYQLVKRKEWVGGLFGWGGLSIGSGFYYINNDMRVELNKLSSISTVISAPYVFSISPTVNFLIKNNTFTIPIDLITSIKLLWILNITAGVGFDFNFGTTSIAINNNNELRIKNSSTGADVTSTPGSVNLSLNPTQPPAIFTPKIMLGLGLKIWAIVIDIPVTFYFPIHQNIPMSQSGVGISAGVTIGAVW